MKRIILLILMSLSLQATPVQIFAAASTIDALNDIKTNLKAQKGLEIAIHTAGSAILAQQIKHGAPCDIVLLADQKWMAQLKAGGFVQANTIVPLLSNELVIIAAKKNSFGFSEMLKDPTIQVAIAHTEIVPAGRYAKEALEKRGWWPDLQDRLLMAGNVRLALRWVETNQAPMGVVYKTDAESSADVRTVAGLPLPNGVISYPIASCSQSKNPATKPVMDHLTSEESVAYFMKRGFGNGRR